MRQGAVTVKGDTPQALRVLSGDLIQKGKMKLNCENDNYKS